jgi:hypothetical protein
VSTGHRHKSDLSDDELVDLLAEALDSAKIKKRLSEHYTLVTDYDIPLLGSSSIGGRKVYLDRHLKYGPKNGHGGWPYGILPLQGKSIDVRPPLVRHERLEQACEDILGWPYKIAHAVATRWEHDLVKRKGFDPEKYEDVLAPYIKADQHERIVKVPTDLDRRPMLAPPVDRKLIDHVNATTNKEKRTHAAVIYVSKSDKPQTCAGCIHFVGLAYGGPACEGVKDPIAAAGWCRRYLKGAMDAS